MTNALITKIHNDHRMVLSHKDGFIVTVYGSDGRQLGSTEQAKTAHEAFAIGRLLIEGQGGWAKTPLPHDFME